MVKLDDVEPTACKLAVQTAWSLVLMIASVDIFQYWIYTQTLPTYGDFDEWVRILGQTDAEVFLSPHMLEPILGAYVLADRLLAHRLLREINNTIVKYNPMSCIDPDRAVAAITYAFENIAAERPILQFLVDDFCQHCRTPATGKLFSGFERRLEEMPSAFGRRVRRRLENVDARPKSGFCYREHLSCTAICDYRHTSWDVERQFLTFGPAGKINHSQACMP